MSRKAAATNKKRNNSQEHKAALVLQEQIRAYAAAVKEAKATGQERPFIWQFVPSMKPVERNA